MKRGTWIAAVALALALPAASQGQPFWSETFDADLGDFTAFNDASTTPNAWLWDGTCPATGEPGHTIAGTAHWINPATCLDYGDTGSKGDPGSFDYIRSIRVEVPAECTLGVRLDFNYFLDFNEGACYDQARVITLVDNSLETVVADNGLCDEDRPADRGALPRPESIIGNSGIGGLTDSRRWLPVSRFVPNAGPGSLVEILVVAETTDGFLNQGEGFLVDDFVLSCVQPFYEVPALSTVGFGAFGALLAVAAVVALARRRRQA
jgi:hypothetical protein